MTRRPLQTELFGEPPLRPEGLLYRPDLISAEEEAGLIDRFADMPFEAFDFHGFKGHRRVIYFGWRYDFSRASVEGAEAIPDFLLPLQARVADMAGVEPAVFAQCLINQYAPGAGIGWHRDRPQFGKVAGVSLGSDCVMRFRRASGKGWERLAVPLEARSAYLLDGPARSQWQHSISPHEQLRYSVTFRTIREEGGGAA